MTIDLTISTPRDISDARMLEAIQEIVDTGREKTRRDVYERIEVNEKNIRPIRIGRSSFTNKQLRLMGREYGYSGDWLLGIGRKKWRR